MQGKLAIILLVAVAAFARPPKKEFFELNYRPNGGSENIQKNFTLEWWPPATYEQAKSDCIEYNSQFAELETKEEEDFVIEWILGLKLVDFVWVAGKWNGNDSFIWESGVPIRNDFSWLPSEPIGRNEDSRVALAVTNTTSGFMTAPETEIFSFLCQKQ